MKKSKPMLNVEATIQPKDVTGIRRHIRWRGRQQASLDLFGQETYLVEHVGNRFEAVRRLLKKNGLPASKMDAVLHALTRLVMEPLLVLDQAHQRLWHDLMPVDELMRTQWKQCTGIGKVRRMTFADYAWEPRQVQSFRPDWTEFQAKCFLECYQLEISKAMRIAGAQAISRLLKEEAERCKP